MGDLKVRRRKIANVRNGEPWIYPNALFDQDIDAGFYHIIDDVGDHVGYADVNPKAPVVGRILTFANDWPGEKVFLNDMILGAIERRIRLGYAVQGGAVRLVNAEGDGLPGLVMDCFGSVVVVDFYSAGMAERREAIEMLFAERLADFSLVFRMGPDAAKREGVEPFHDKAGEVSFCEHGVRYEIPMGDGQKTGFYLDQRDNRRIVANLGRGRRILDLFCYHGGFSLSALINGAEWAMAVDSSESALECALTNAANNGVELATLQGDVFDVMDDLEEQGPFGLIICDPPKLAPSKRDRQRGLKAYRFLVSRCLKLLAPNGVLMVCSCSQAIQAEDLRVLLMQQARKTHMPLDVISVSGHASDHPWPVGFPTGRYLSTIVVERRA